MDALTGFIVGYVVGSFIVLWLFMRNRRLCYNRRVSVCKFDHRWGVMLTRDLHQCLAYNHGEYMRWLRHSPRPTGGPDCFHPAHHASPVTVFYSKDLMDLVLKDCFKESGDFLVPPMNPLDPWLTESVLCLWKKIHGSEPSFELICAAKKNYPLLNH